jgi:hypothetical protein
MFIYETGPRDSKPLNIFVYIKNVQKEYKTCIKYGKTLELNN